MSWEVTDDEINAACHAEFQRKGWCAASVNRAIATAAVQKYQSWLAKQVGPNPCEKCAQIGDPDFPCSGSKWEQLDCGKFQRYLGQQSVLGIQEGRKHE